LFTPIKSALLRRFLLANVARRHKNLLRDIGQIVVFVAFLIMLREGTEAAIIVGIVSSYLAQTGRRQWLPAVWIGIIGAIVACVALAAGLNAAGAEFPQRQQEMFEGCVAVIAVVMLTSMVFWMRKAARSIASDLRASVDAALSRQNRSGFALASLAFLAVGREGLETIFFLSAIVQQSHGRSILIGAALGLICAFGIGSAIYVGGTRINLRRFFQWTGVFIIFVAAGLLAGAVRAFHEAGIWNGFQGATFDLSNILPADGILGTLLGGFFGYQEAPTVGELVAYFGFLIPVLALFFTRPYRRPTAASPVASNVH
jgi:high-affinity iron transporter